MPPVLRSFLISSLRIPQPQPVAAITERTVGERLLAELSDSCSFAGVLD